MKTKKLEKKDRSSVLRNLANEVNAGGPRCCYTTCTRCQ